MKGNKKFMKTETYDKLKKLYDKYNAQEFGKICQKLLALSFCNAGYGHIVERGVQGVDVDAVKENGERYAIEVKTSKYDTINFQKKDVEGLQKRKVDGYKPVLAVLRLNRFSNLIFVKADNLDAGIKHIDNLFYHINELEETISPIFDEIVRTHYYNTLKNGQKYLDDQLKKVGAEVNE